MNSNMILNLDVWTGSKVGSWHATLMREILLIQGEILYEVDTLHLSALFRKLFTFATSQLLTYWGKILPLVILGGGLKPTYWSKIKTNLF